MTSRTGLVPMSARVFALVIGAAALTSAATASETVTYSYDALARLVKVARAGTVNNTASECYAYDPASNRSNVTDSTAGDCSNTTALTLSPATLPNGMVGTAYSQTITATGGTAPYSFVKSAGSLPAGLTLSSGGVLSGTPTTATSYSFTVQATDSAAHTGTRAYSLTIGASTNHAPVANPDSLTVRACGTGTVNVVANDTDADGDAITLLSVSGGMWGTASVASSTSVQYVADTSGRTDTVTYTIQDAHGATANGTLTVTISTGVCQ